MKQLISLSSFSQRVLGLLLVAGLLAAPALSAGQATTPAGAPAPAAAVQSAPSSQAAPSSVTTEVTPGTEEEDLNVYRHAAIVRTLAKMMHMKLETTARFFEAINFLIIALAIGIPLVKLLPRIIRKRSETLRHNVEAARKVTEDANTRLSAVEAKLSKLDDEIAAIRNHVEEEGKQDEARIKAAIEEESSRIVAAAEQEIGVAAAQAQRGLRHFAAELAIERAAGQLVLTPETDRELIAEFMKETSNGAGKGGQN